MAATLRASPWLRPQSVGKKKTQPNIGPSNNLASRSVLQASNRMTIEAYWGALRSINEGFNADGARDDEIYKAVMDSKAQREMRPKQA